MWSDVRRFWKWLITWLSQADEPRDNAGGARTNYPRHRPPHQLTQQAHASVGVQPVRGRPVPVARGAASAHDHDGVYTPPPRPAPQRGLSSQEPGPVKTPTRPGVLPVPVAASAPASSRPRRSEAAPASWSAPRLEPPGPIFEPKPSLSQAYRPDTVADGWSTPDFTVRLASVRGYDHRYSGAPRQDDMAVVHHVRTGAVVFAVADGVSAAPLSHIGATAACRAAISAMIAGLESESRRVDWQALVQTAAWQICEQAKLVLALPEVDTAVADEQMATTLVCGMVVPTSAGPEVSLIQVGDTSAWRLRGATFDNLLTPKYHADAAISSSAVTALPRLPQVSPRVGTLADDEVLLVGTDGFGDPLGDGAGVVGRHFAEALADVPPILRFANDLDFSKETFDDDRTLFALWPRQRG
jgi:serine/threonine protein phosphatase PrpC